MLTHKVALMEPKYALTVPSTFDFKVVCPELELEVLYVITE